MLLLGAIADDLTGATDLASTLANEGLRVVQVVGVPARGLPVPDADAIVIALKSRSIPSDQAVALSLEALQWLKQAGARQVVFKYCSTFDSTDRGNIGPVAEALMTSLGADLTIFCPAFPKNGRRVFQGHLFVGDRLLSDSGMQVHPLTPMTDPDVVRVLGRQVEGPVSLIPFEIVEQGWAAIRAALDQCRRAGVKHVVVDAVTDAHLVAIGRAAQDLPLVTGGSAIAQGLPENFRRLGLLSSDKAGRAHGPKVDGPAVVLAGSCSRATLRQIDYFKARRPFFRIDAMKLADGDDQVAAAWAWARDRMGPEPILIYASALPEDVQAMQHRLGRETAGALVEAAIGQIAVTLVRLGAARLIVAGGETSGAVIAALGLRALAIGPEIDPGVPWTFSIEGKPLAIALKSGNFGAEDVLVKAFGALERAADPVSTRDDEVGRRTLV